MFASNLPMKYIGKGPNPYLKENGAATAGETGGEPPAKRKGNAKVETTTKAPVLKAQSVCNPILLPSSGFWGMV